MGGWLDQVGIRLSQLSTKLKLKLKLEVKDEHVVEETLVQVSPTQFEAKSLLVRMGWCIK